MLLIGVTGPIASGKTTLLLDFAEKVAASGRSVDGFVSLAGRRLRSNEGAESYSWYWIREARTEVFAQRNGEGRFEIDSTATAALAAWSDALIAKQDLIVLDEFGKWEAEGGGILSCWSKVVASKPKMVVVTLREGMRQAIEKQLGHRFHEVLDVESDEVLVRLESLLAEMRDWEYVGTYGALSGGIECSLGTWLHSFRFPFTGTVMGSAQSATLAMASKSLGRKELVVWISTIAAGLKALAPGSNRIGPTIAIAVQGALFMAGAMLGRWSRLGMLMGAFLVGLWAALQGFFIQYLLLGFEIERAYGMSAYYVQRRLHLSLPNIWVAVTLLALMNGLLSVGLTALVLKRWNDHPLQTEPFEKTRSGWRRLFFWLPLGVVILTYLVSDVPKTQIGWILLRVLAVSGGLYGLGLFLKNLNLSRVFSRRGMWGPALAVQVAQDHRTSGDSEGIVPF